MLKAMVIRDNDSLLPWLMGYWDRWASYSRSYLFGGTPRVLLEGNSSLQGDLTLGTSLPISTKGLGITSFRIVL